MVDGRVSRETKQSIVITILVLLVAVFIGLGILIFGDTKACLRLPGTGIIISPYGDRVHEC